MRVLHNKRLDFDAYKKLWISSELYGNRKNKNFIHFYLKHIDYEWLKINLIPNSNEKFDKCNLSLYLRYTNFIIKIYILRIFTYFLFTVIYLITVHISTHMPRNHWHPSPIVTHLVINWAYPETTDKKTIFDIYTICFSDSNLIYLIIQIRLWFIPFQLKNW